MHFTLQFINIVVNLLDALKTSFSHRSMAARSLGKKDSVSEAAVAGLSLLKVRKCSGRPPLWSSGQSSWLHNGDVLCLL
jgi:hypothetical protein